MANPSSQLDCCAASQPPESVGCCGQDAPSKPTSCCDSEVSVAASQAVPTGGCGCESESGSDAGGGHWREWLPLAISVPLLVMGLVFNEALRATPFSIAEYAVLLPAYLLCGWGVLTTAGRNILRGRIFDENFLMTIATLGAIAIHELPEAVGVMLFYQIGERVQGIAVGRSRRSIRALLAVRPKTANLERDGEVQAVSPETVPVGATIWVRPGENVPLDGEVLTGQSHLNTAALTGESMPRPVAEGDAVYAGCVNQSGGLRVRVTRPFADSSIARILDLVENARSKKANTERFITRFARYYTPVVVALSLAIALLPPLLIPGADAATWSYRALVMLVISCPCGLVISVPLGYFGGIGGAARRGILVKGSSFLDALTQVKTVVFDKTGTLTQGQFQVTDVVPHNGLTPAQLLELAAQAEAHSNHPVAHSIRRAHGQSLDMTGVSHYEEIAGHGVRATVNGRTVLAGSDRLLHREAVPHDICRVDGTFAHLAVDGHYSGHIRVADQLKDDAADAIRALHRQHIATVMLTGDSQSVAADIAQQLTIDHYRANLLPEDKVEALEDILATVDHRHHKVAFVGDGLNDAPVIARADVGMAMGGLGSDAAIETADVVIMTDAPTKVAEAIAIARRTRRIVWQNIAMALGIKLVFIALGAIGLATLWEAVFADVGVALLAILNASRVLHLPAR